MSQCATLHRTELLSCQSLGFFDQVRFSTEPIVKEKGPINVSCLHMYKILQSTRFKMYLPVILHFDSAQGEARVLPYIGYIGMSSVRGTFF